MFLPWYSPGATPSPTPDGERPGMMMPLHRF
jgi:hypothetical protein